VCASLDEHGAWLSLGSAHSRLGFVELSALPRFNERDRGDPAAVRRYRALMTQSRYAFLQLEAPGWRRRVSTRAPTGRSELEQEVLLTANEPRPPVPVIRFRGTLDRPPFAEITELDPLPPTGARTELRAQGQTLRSEAPMLPACAEIRVTGSSHTWEIAASEARLEIAGGDPAATRLELSIVCTLLETES
jgi:hypothetical protein